MSLLGLWHPAGACAGDGVLRIGDPALEPDGSLDVAVVAPARGTRRRRLRALVAEAGIRLAPDGIGWIVVERRARASGERAARRAGLVVVDRVLMIPGWPASTHLVPLVPAALRDAGVRHLGLSPRSARVLALLARAGATRMLLARAAPSCAVVVARRAPPAPLAWLGEIDGAGVWTATVSSGPRRDASVAVALRHRTGCARPDLAVKVALDAAGAARVHAERDALELLGAAAAAAGAAIAVPRTRAAGGPAILVADALPGQPAAALLRRSPAQLDAVLRAVGDWLLAWNRATATTATASQALLERRLVAPAARLAAARPALAQHAEAMRRLAASLEGTALVTVAVHDDLTMSNVLVGPSGLAIVDWEAASADGLPLLDLWYALADGVARARRVAHVQAVEMLTRGSSPLPPALAGLPGRHAAALGISTGQALLGFHACWLSHADDELRRRQAGPFLPVVEALAAQGGARA